MPDSIVEEYLRKIEEYRNLIEDLPDRAREFGESVDEKLASIGEEIEKRDRITDPQIGAIDNMCAGIDRWFD